MSPHHCDRCGNLLDAGYPCSRCNYDGGFHGKDRLAFDGGREIETLESHLQAALEAETLEEAQFHVRQALQYRAGEEGDGKSPPFSSGGGGVTD